MNRKPLQFGIAAVMAATVVVAVLFGTLRWLNVPPQVSTVVLAILLVSVATAVGLVVAISQSGDRE